MFSSCSDRSHDSWQFGGDAGPQFAPCRPVAPASQQDAYDHDSAQHCDDILFLLQCLFELIVNLSFLLRMPSSSSFLIQYLHLILSFGILNYMYNKLQKKMLNTIVITVHDFKAYTRVELQLHPFLISALHGGAW